MFEQFFGLSENPFSLTPDPRFIFASRSHDEALAHLKYWLEHKEGFALVTGEVGTGKTTALFRLIDGLERRYEIAFITNSTLSPVDLLEEICRKFGLEVEPGTSKPALLQKLETYLTRQMDRGNGSLLIIDEAQNFEQPLLEEVRLLSNIARPGGPPMLQIALIGQPELERKLSLPELRQLKQRIGVHYRIEPLNADETLKYIHHRVGVAGGYPRVLFPQDTVTTLFQKTNGLPRELNQVASQALLGAYVEDSSTVRPDHIHGAVREMGFRSVLEGVKPTPAAAVPEPPPRPTPTMVEVRPRAARVDPISVEPAATAPHVLAPARQSAEPAPVVAPTPKPVDTPNLRPEPARLTPAPAPKAPRRSAPRTTAAVPNFGSLAPLSTPRVADVPPSEGRVRLARIGLIIGALTILGVAGYLLMMPQKPQPDELADLESGTTMPVAPRGGSISTPVGAVPSPSQSAGAAGTAAPDNRTTPGPGGARSDMPPKAVEPATIVPAPAPPSDPAPTATTAGGYRLQVASLRDSAAAARVGRELATRARLPVEIVGDRKPDGASWYAIYLGDFATSEAAAAARQELSATIREFNGALIRSPRRR